MQLSCIHCGKPFTISVDQLGGSGTCPHCHGEIQLPKAGGSTEEVAEEPSGPPTRWWENSVSTLVSVVFHMLLMLILALIGYQSSSGEGMGESVLIGNLPSETLSDAMDEDLNLDSEVSESSEQEFEELELAPMAAASDAELATLAEPTPLSGGDSGGVEMGTITIGGGSMAGGSWNGLMQNLRRNGLDIVITFDSTASMGGYIGEVKQQIHRIGSTLVKLVPKARISICTYRDQRDEYVVKGLPLTGNIQEIDAYLAQIGADGGGDNPEAVHEGLRWATEENQFRGSARKVVLLFGDAPPHREFYDDCLRIASDFARQKQGVVSTVTCKATRMREFEQIAETGGGEAFLTSDERRIMTELLTLVFGSKHRGKVIEAFELMDRS